MAFHAGLDAPSLLACLKIPSGIDRREEAMAAEKNMLVVGLDG
jgi:hypothetical protein